MEINKCRCNNKWSSLRCLIAYFIEWSKSLAGIPEHPLTPLIPPPVRIARILRTTFRLPSPRTLNPFRCSHCSRPIKYGAVDIPTAQLVMVDHEPDASKINCIHININCTCAQSTMNKQIMIRIRAKKKKKKTARCEHWTRRDVCDPMVYNSLSLAITAHCFTQKSTNYYCFSIYKTI